MVNIARLKVDVTTRPVVSSQFMTREIPEKSDLIDRLTSFQQINGYHRNMRFHCLGVIRHNHRKTLIITINYHEAFDKHEINHPETSEEEVVCK